MRKSGAVLLCFLGTRCPGKEKKSLEAKIFKIKYEQEESIYSHMAY